MDGSVDNLMDDQTAGRPQGLQSAPKPAIGDGALDFWAALYEAYPQTRQQRCWVHKMANVLNYLPKSVQPKAKTALQQIWMAESRAAAQTVFEQHALHREIGIQPEAMPAVGSGNELVLIGEAEAPVDRAVHPVIEPAEIGVPVDVVQNIGAGRTVDQGFDVDVRAGSGAGFKQGQHRFSIPRRAKNCSDFGALREQQTIQPTAVVVVTGIEAQLVFQRVAVRNVRNVVQQCVAAGRQPFFGIERWPVRSSMERRILSAVNSVPMEWLRRLCSAPG